MGKGAGSQRLSTAVDPFSASSGPRPPLHPHPDAREGEWGGVLGATAVKWERVIDNASVLYFLHKDAFT